MPVHRFKKGEQRPENAGRRAGTPNKFTSLKQSFLNVYDMLGGDDALKTWAKKNPGDFFHLLARLLPKQVDITGQIDHMSKADELNDNFLAGIAVQGKRSNGSNGKGAHDNSGTA